MKNQKNGNMKKLSRVAVDMKILLLLRTYQKYRDSFEVPFALTQMGIAREVQIHRAAAARSLNQMKRKGLVVSDTRHVSGASRKRKVYFLTEKGFQLAKEVEEQILQSEILVIEREEREKRPVQVKALLKRRKDGINLLRICNNLQDGVLDLRLVEKDIEKKFYFSEDVPIFSSFTGRKKELAELISLVKSGRVSGIVIQGIAGIGKTSLAAKVAEEFKDKRHVFWFSFHPWTTSQSFISRFLGLLFVHLKGEKEAFSLSFKDEITSERFEDFIHQSINLLKHSQILLILDDVHLAKKAIGDFIGALLGEMKNVKKVTILMTSRTTPDFYDRRLVHVEKRVVEYNLSGLSFEDAFAFVKSLRKETPASLTEFTSENLTYSSEETVFPFQPFLNQKEFEVIYKEVEGHPFALELMATMGFHSAKIDFDRFLDKEILEHLKKEELSVLMFFSLFRTPVEIKTFLEVVPDKSVSRHDIEELVKKHLLKWKDGFLTLHGLIRDVVAGHLTKSLEKEYHKSAAAYYLALLRKMEVNLNLSEEKWWHDKNLLVIEQIYHLLKGDDYKKAISLIFENSDEFISCGYPEFYELVQMVEAERLKEEERKKFLEILGDAHGAFGSFERAFETYMKKLEKEKEDSLERAKLLQKMGELKKEKGELDASIEFKKKSLSIFQKKKNYLETARVYNELGLDYWSKGEIKKARASFLKALSLVKKLGSSEHLSQILLNLAHLESEVGQDEEAESYLKESLKIGEDGGERIRAYSLSAEFALKKGEKERALENYKKAFEIAKKGRELRALLLLLKKLKNLCFEMGKEEEARKLLSSGIDFLEKEAREKKGGWIGSAKGGFSALTKTQQSFLKENFLFASLCQELASLYEKLGKFEKSYSYYIKASKIYMAFEDSENLATVFLKLGQNALRRGKMSEGARFYKEAFLLFERAGNIKGCAVSLLNFAAVIERSGEREEKKLSQLYKRAEELSLQAGFKKGIEISKRKREELEGFD